MMNKTHLALAIVSSIALSGMAFAADMASPPNSLVVTDSGYVGVGTSQPPSSLSVIGDSATEEDVQMLVVNANTADPGVARRLFVIKNDGPAKFSMWASSTDEWAFNAREDVFRISKQLTGTVEMELSSVGNLKITGILTQGSSRTIKHDIRRVDTQDVLEKVLAMPISTWSYKRDTDGWKHLGPMAEDFYQAFGLGASEKGISSIDTGGVALAAIKGLNQIVQEKEARITRQEEKISVQEQQIELLKQRLTRMEAQQERLTQLEELLRDLTVKGEVAQR